MKVINYCLPIVQKNNEDFLLLIGEVGCIQRAVWTDEVRLYPRVSLSLLKLFLPDFFRSFSWFPWTYWRRSPINTAQAQKHPYVVWIFSFSLGSQVFLLPQLRISFVFFFFNRINLQYNSYIPYVYWYLHCFLFFFYSVQYAYSIKTESDNVMITIYAMITIIMLKLFWTHISISILQDLVVFIVLKM